MPRAIVRAPGHDRNRSLGWLSVAWMEYFVVHDCRMTSDLARQLTPAEARLALVDEQLEACGFCRPDTELGIDIGT